MAAHSFYKLHNIASLEVEQVRHLERSWQMTGHVHRTAVLHGMGVSSHVMTKNKKYDRKNTTRIDIFIHGVLLQSASRRQCRKMQGVDNCMQAA